MQNFFRLIYLNLVLLPNSAFLPKVIKLGLGCLRVEIPVCHFPLFSFAEENRWHGLFPLRPLSVCLDGTGTKLQMNRFLCLQQHYKCNNGLIE